MINYQIRQRPRPFLYRYEITDEDGHLLYSARGTVFSKKVTIYDVDDYPLLTIHKRIFSFKKEHFIYVDGTPRFRIWRKISIHPEIYVESLSEPDAFYIQGSAWKGEYAFYQEGEEFAYVTKKRWSIRDIYGVSINEDRNQAEVLAMSIVIDLIRHSGKKK